MKLTVDLIALRESAKRRIDVHFSNQIDPLKIEAHRRKREEATAIIDERDFFETPLLSAEALRRGLVGREDIKALARDILDKPDMLVLVENERRKAAEALNAASTPAEVQSLLRSIGVDPSLLNVALTRPVI